MKQDYRHNGRIALELPPVGVKIFSNGEKMMPMAKVFDGVSFCQAVSEATAGKKVFVKAGSINVCKWSPVVLGFKKAEDSFEETIAGALPPDTVGVYLAPLDMFGADEAPDVVIIRTTPENYRTIIDVLGWDAFIDYAPLEQDMTALQFLQGHPPRGVSGWLIRNVNKWLDRLNRFGWWHNFTTTLFKSWLVTRVFDRFIAKFMANMSMCRNSLAIPYVKGKANISYFCTGGIAWGKNSSLNMTSGFPFDIYQALARHIDWRGTSC